MVCSGFEPEAAGWKAEKNPPCQKVPTLERLEECQTFYLYS